MNVLQNIGGLVTARPALRPVSQAAAAAFSLKGPGLDRSAWESLLLMVQVGLATGAPASFTVDAKLQHSDTDVDGNYVDVVADVNNPAVAIAQITAASTQKHLEIALTGLKQWVRIVFTVAFSGGTSPTILLAADFVVGGGPILPAVHA